MLRSAWPSRRLDIKRSPGRPLRRATNRVLRRGYGESVCGRKAGKSPSQTSRDRVVHADRERARSRNSARRSAIGTRPPRNNTSIGKEFCPCAACQYHQSTLRAARRHGSTRYYYRGKLVDGGAARACDGLPQSYRSSASSCSFGRGEAAACEKKPGVSRVSREKNRKTTAEWQTTGLGNHCEVKSTYGCNYFSAKIKRYHPIVEASSLSSAMGTQPRGEYLRMGKCATFMRTLRNRANRWRASVLLNANAIGHSGPSVQ